MKTLYFPVLSFHEGENVTLRLGSDWAKLFGNGDTVVEIKQLGHTEVHALADISRVENVPFGMVQQEWIDEASYQGVTNLDSLYNFMTNFYGIFDCESFVSVIYFTLRP